MVIPPTTTRVERQTDPQINEEIRNRTERNVVLHALAGRTALDRRIKELDEEWDIERVLEANASSLSLMGLALGAYFDRRWFFLPAAVTGFLLQHAVQGWCPPIPLFRRMGIRTNNEIQQERHALKALRGDYRGIPGMSEEAKTGNVSEATRAFEAAGHNSSY